MARETVAAVYDRRSLCRSLLAGDLHSESRASGISLNAVTHLVKRLVLKPLLARWGQRAPPRKEPYVSTRSRSRLSKLEIRNSNFEIWISRRSSWFRLRRVGRWAWPGVPSSQERKRNRRWQTTLHCLAKYRDGGGRLRRSGFMPDIPGIPVGDKPQPAAEPRG